MKAIEVPEWGYGNLREVERPDPEPGPGEVLLRMKGACLNFRDWLTVEGKYNPRQPLPLIPLSDGVGEVVEVGEGVTRFAIGDRVCPIFCQAWMGGEPTRDRLRSSLGGPLDGTLRELMVVPAESAVAVPEHLTDAEAATLPCAAVTAWSALSTLGGVRAGDRVLLQGTGGVSLFALQFAKLLGAQVMITSSSDEKLERATALGADHTLNYREVADWGKAARKWSGGVGVDHVVEVGGAGTLAQTMKAIRVGGTISLIGVLAGAREPLNILPILMNQVRVQGVLVGHRDSFEAMNRAIAAAQMRPVVDEVFDWREIGSAFEHLRDGKHFGKVSLTLG